MIRLTKKQKPFLLFYLKDISTIIRITSAYDGPIEEKRVVCRICVRTHRARNSQSNNRQASGKSKGEEGIGQPSIIVLRSLLRPSISSDLRVNIS